MPGSYARGHVTLVRQTNQRMIAELEWSQGRNIAFTTITSCLGLVGSFRGASIIGVHLPMVDGSGTNVTVVGTKALVDAVGKVFGKLCADVFIVGESAVWERSAPQYLDALVAAFKVDEYQLVRPARSGNYMARAIDAAPFVEVFREGAQLTVADPFPD